MPERKYKKVSEPIAPKELTERYMPTLNEDAIKRLRQLPLLFVYKPFVEKPNHSKITHASVVFQCMRALAEYKSRVFFEIDKWTDEGRTPTAELHLKETLRALKEDHDLALHAIKREHFRKRFDNGVILTTKPEFPIPQRQKRKKEVLTSAQEILRRVPRRKEKPGKVIAKFKSTHMFAVMDGKIVPLIEFPSLK